MSRSEAELREVCAEVAKQLRERDWGDKQPLAEFLADRLEDADQKEPAA